MNQQKLLEELRQFPGLEELPDYPYEMLKSADLSIYADWLEDEGNPLCEHLREVTRLLLTCADEQQVGILFNALRANIPKSKIEECLQSDGHSLWVQALISGWTTTPPQTQIALPPAASDETTEERTARPSGTTRQIPRHPR